MNSTENKCKTITRAAGSDGKPETVAAETGIVSKPETAGAAEIACKTKNAAASGNGSLTKKPALNPVAALALCALLWSFGGLVIKLIKWDALAIAGVRS
ncbi:MAG: hypothetical protein II814_09460, partial [Treponema sp.]|nr:hypothetical protein [Treponema sp.]